jgi:hypothetical protein
VVEGDEAAALVEVGDAGGGGDLEHGAVALVVPQAHGVHEVEVGVPAVGHDEVLVGVVVVVEEGGAPAPAAVAYAGEVGGVAELAAALVAIHAVAGLADGAGDGGDEEVEVAVAVEVADGGAHAVLVGAEAGGDGAVEEGAVALVPEQAAAAEVAGDDEVGPAVGVEVGEAGGEGEGAGDRELDVDGLVDVIDVDAGEVRDVLEVAGLLAAAVA